MLTTSLEFHNPPCPYSTQAFWMSCRRLAGVGFQAFFTLAMVLAACGFLRRLFRRAQGCLIWRRPLGVFREPLAFYRCGRPAARTGRLRAVCHGRQGARPLMANCGWHHGSPAGRRPRRIGLSWTGESGGLWTRRDQCGRWVLLYPWPHCHPSGTFRYCRCLHQRCPAGWSPAWREEPFFSPIGQEYPFLQVSEIFLSRPAVSA